MDEQESIDESQQVVGVPEGIEAGQEMDWGWKLDYVPPERVCGQREGERH